MEYENSRSITKDPTKVIYEQKNDYETNQIDNKKIKSNIKALGEKRNIEKLNEISNQLSEKQQRLNDIYKNKGASNWLTVLPLSDHNFDLNKQQFWDAIRLRYGWPIPNLSLYCVCGSTFNMQHCMSCKKGGFVTLRHNSVRNILPQIC